MGELNKLISSLKHAKFLKLAELEKILKRLDESSDVSIIRLVPSEEISDALKRIKLKSRSLYQMLRENEALVRNNRVVDKDTYIICSKSSSAVIFELPGDCNPIEEGEKIPVKQVINNLGLQEKIIIADDGERLIVWKVSKLSTSRAAAVHIQGMPDIRKSEALKNAVKGYIDRKFYCIFNPDNTWVMRVLEELSINPKVFATGDVNLNPLHRVVSRFDDFINTRIYSEDKILTHFFSQLDQNAGTIVVGLERTTMAYESSWIRCWVVSEATSHDVIHLRMNNEISVVFVGSNQPLPDQYQHYMFVSRSPLLHWLRRFDEVLMVSNLTDQGERLESNFDGIGAILNGPYDYREDV